MNEPSEKWARSVKRQAKATYSSLQNKVLPLTLSIPCIPEVQERANQYLREVGNEVAKMDDTLSCTMKGNELVIERKRAT